MKLSSISRWLILVCVMLSSRLAVAAEEAPTPPAVDLRPAFAKWGLGIRSQGGRPTCSVFTVVGALEFAVSEKLRSGQRLSVEYLNWASNDVVGRAQDGGFFSDLWKGFERHGICPDDAMPYSEQFTTAQTPNPAATGAAKKLLSLGLQFNWIKEWNVRTGLSSEQLAQIRKTLANGFPVCGGFRWPKREKWTDNTLQMCRATDVFDGHSVLLIGYKADDAIPGGGAFLIRNSNGSGGESWMPFAYAGEFMNDAAWIGSTTNL